MQGTFKPLSTALRQHQDILSYITHHDRVSEIGWYHPLPVSEWNAKRNDGYLRFSSLQQWNELVPNWVPIGLLVGLLPLSSKHISSDICLIHPWSSCVCVCLCFFSRIFNAFVQDCLTKPWKTISLAWKFQPKSVMMAICWPQIL